VTSWNTLLTPPTFNLEPGHAGGTLQSSGPASSTAFGQCGQTSVAPVPWPA
jgi:hypothetical protein